MCFDAVHESPRAQTTAMPATRAVERREHSCMQSVAGRIDDSAAQQSRTSRAIRHAVERKLRQRSRSAGEPNTLAEQGKHASKQAARPGAVGARRACASPWPCSHANVETRQRVACERIRTASPQDAASPVELAPPGRQHGRRASESADAHARRASPRAFERAPAARCAHSR